MNKLLLSAIVGPRDHLFWEPLGGYSNWLNQWVRVEVWTEEFDEVFVVACA